MPFKLDVGMPSASYNHVEPDSPGAGSVHVRLLPAPSTAPLYATLCSTAPVLATTSSKYTGSAVPGVVGSAPLPMRITLKLAGLKMKPAGEFVAVGVVVAVLEAEPVLLLLGEPVVLLLGVPVVDDVALPVCVPVSRELEVPVWLALGVPVWLALGVSVRLVLGVPV